MFFPKCFNAPSSVFGDRLVFPYFKTLYLIPANKFFFKLKWKEAVVDAIVPDPACKLKYP